MTSRIEKAIRAAMALKNQIGASIELKKNGNHVIYFYDTNCKVIARFTLRQILTKNKGLK